MNAKEALAFVKARPEVAAKVVLCAYRLQLTPTVSMAKQLLVGDALGKRGRVAWNKMVAALEELMYALVEDEG